MTGYTEYTLRRKKEEIYQLAFRLARHNVRDLRLGNKFIAEEMRYSDSIINRVLNDNMAYNNALMDLYQQSEKLRKINRDLTLARIRLFALIEIEKSKNSTKTLILKNIGFISGILQLSGGIGICYASVGSACGGLGAPLFLHGAENAYENAYYLLLRKDPHITPLRTAYRSTAALIGGNARQADIAYSVGDIGLSLATGFRSELKPDAWKLYRYIKEDFILGWKSMGAAGVTSEMVGNSASGYAIWQLNGSGGSKWQNLSEEPTR